MSEAQIAGFPWGRGAEEHGMARLTIFTLATLAALLFSSPARAAYISIDDSDPDFISFSAVDFEFGITVDGVPYLGGILVLPDDLHSIEGSWIDLGLNGAGTPVSVLYAMPGQPDGVTSGIEFTATSDGFAATLAGGFGGFAGAPYFFTADPTIDQTSGLTGLGAAAFLTMEFTPEGGRRVVPEPATFGLVMMGLAAAWRRARHAQVRR